MKGEQDFKTKLSAKLNQTEKIDLMNEYAWEIRKINPLKSLEISKQTFDLSKKENYENGLGFSLLISGSSYYRLSIFQSGFFDLKKALKIFSLVQNKIYLSYCLHYLGNISSSLEKFDEAIEFYEKAGSISVEIDDQVGITYNLGRIGLVHFLCGKNEEAHFYLSNAKNILIENGDEIGLADVLINIGKNYFALSQIDNSLKCFTKALSLSKKNKYFIGVSNSLKNLGIYFDHSKNFDIAETYFLEALEIADNIEEKFLALKITSKLADLYEKTADFKKAFEFLKKHDAYTSEIQKISNQHSINSLQIQFDIDELEKEKDIHEVRKNEFSQFQNDLEDKNIKLELLSLVASQSDNVIIIMDALGEVNFVNDSFVRFNSCGLDEIKKIKGKTIFEISNNPDIRNIVETCISERKSISYESLNVSESGNEVWGSALLTPVFDVFGELTNLIIVENDITERKRNAEIIHAKNLDITASITYAKRIQEAILPNQLKIRHHFLDSFIFNQPKDIVSGDFYWFDRLGDHVLFALADCTGHGVPGAFMSMIGVNLLTQIVNDSSITSPEKVLENLDVKIKKSLKQTGEVNETTDGMDIAFLEFSFIKSISSDNVTLNYAGAYRPLWIIRNNELIEIQPNKESIGGGNTKMKKFTNNTIDVFKGDVLYLFTDGCVDQFGGRKGKKFRTNGLRELLLGIHKMPMKDQEKMISSTLNAWRGNLEQVDDILIMGFKFK